MSASQQQSDAELLRLMLAGDEEAFTALLYGIARNHVLRAFERERALVQFDDEAEESGDAPHENFVARHDPLGDLTRGETVERLRQAVLALPAHYREALVLCELHEMSYAEAADALNCAVGTVRSRLHRARAMLAEKLRGREQREGEQAEKTRADAEDGAASQALRTARCFA